MYWEPILAERSLEKELWVIPWSTNSGGWRITGAPDDVGATSRAGWAVGDDVVLKLKAALLGLVAVARE